MNNDSFPENKRHSKSSDTDVPDILSPAVSIHISQEALAHSDAAKRLEDTSPITEQSQTGSQLVDSADAATVGDERPMRDISAAQENHWKVERAQLRDKVRALEAERDQFDQDKHALRQENRQLAEGLDALARQAGASSPFTREGAIGKVSIFKDFVTNVAEALAQGETGRKESARVKMEVERLKMECQRSDADNENLRSQIAAWQTKNNQNDMRLKEMMRQLHDRDRDPYTTSVFADGDLRPDMIYYDFRRFKEQEIHTAAQSLLPLLHQSSLAKQGRKVLTARTKAVLTHHLLIDEVARKGAGRLRTEAASVLEIISHMLIPTPIREDISGRVSSLFAESLSQYWDNISNDQNIEGIHRTIRDIQEDLEIQHTLPTEVNVQLSQLIKRASDLIGHIYGTSPPGQLLTAEPGETYCPDIHELQAGCAAEGEITYMICPGYRIGEETQWMPVVFTYPLS